MRKAGGRLRRRRGSSALSVPTARLDRTMIGPSEMKILRFFIKRICSGRARDRVR